MAKSKNETKHEDQASKLIPMDQTVTCWPLDSTLADHTRTLGFTPFTGNFVTTDLTTRKRKKTVTPKQAALICLALGVGAGLYLHFSGMNPLSLESASASQAPKPKLRAIQKRSKGPAAQAQAANQAQARPEPPPQPPTAAATGLAETTAMAPAAPQPPPGVPVPEKKFIRLSQQGLTAIAPPRSPHVVTYSKEETLRLQQTVLMDEQAKAVAKKWREDASFAALTPPKPTQLAGENDPGLQDLEALRAYHYAALLNGDLRYFEKIKEHILAWAKTYKPRGDAIAESRFEPLIEAYLFAQDKLSGFDKAAVDEWLLLLADQQVATALERGRLGDRWFAHHLKTVALVGYATGNLPLQNYVRLNITTHLASSLQPDGSSYAFHDESSLRAHADQLAAQLRLTLLLSRRGLADSNLALREGSPLAGSLNFLLDYVNGKKTFAETALAKGREPAAAGATQKFDPKSALEAIELASYFRPELVPVVAKLTGQSANSRFPTPRLLALQPMRRVANERGR